MAKFLVTYYECYSRGDEVEAQKANCNRGGVNYGK